MAIVFLMDLPYQRTHCISFCAREVGFCDSVISNATIHGLTADVENHERKSDTSRGRIDA